MFQPVSDLHKRGAWWRLNEKAQAIVIASSQLGPVDIQTRWRERAAVAMWEDVGIARDIVRDLLANPQIRALVFDGPCESRKLFERIWSGDESVIFTTWKIDREHLELVFRFVDLYDDDFYHAGPQAPFWPTRIRYLA